MGRTAEQVVHGGFVFCFEGFAEGVDFLKEVQSVLGKLKGFACSLVVDELVLGRVDFQVIVVVEIPEDAPANLDFEHFDTFFLKGVKPVQLDVIFVELFQFPEDDFFDCFDVVAVEVCLEDAFLEVSELVIGEFAIEIFVENPEDSHNGFFELGGQLLVVEVIQGGQRVQNSSLGSIEYLFDVAIVVS